MPVLRVLLDRSHRAGPVLRNRNHHGSRDEDGEEQYRVEIDLVHLEQARARLEGKNHSLFRNVEFVCKAGRVSEGGAKYRKTGQRRGKVTRGDVQYTASDGKYKT